MPLEIFQLCSLGVEFGSDLTFLQALLLLSSGDRLHVCPKLLHFHLKLAAALGILFQPHSLLGCNEPPLHLISGGVDFSAKLPKIRCQSIHSTLLHLTALQENLDSWNRERGLFKRNSQLPDF